MYFQPLSKGSRLELSKVASALPSVKVSIISDPASADIDTAIFACAPDSHGIPKLVSEGHMAFFDEPVAAGGAIRRQMRVATKAEHGFEAFTIDFSVLDAKVRSISVIATIAQEAMGRRTFDQFTGLVVQLADSVSGEPFASFALDPVEGCKTAVHLGSFTKAEGRWSFYAIGDSYERQLADFVAAYSPEAPPSPMAVPPAPLAAVAGPVHSVSTLIAAAGQRGICAEQVLIVAQRLYEEGLISYPLTDSVSLPPALAETLLDRLSGLQTVYPKKIRKLLNAGICPMPSEVPAHAHYGIVPTGRAPTAPLTGPYQQVFKLICKQFLASIRLPNSDATTILK